MIMQSLKVKFHIRFLHDYLLACEISMVRALTLTQRLCNVSFAHK